MNNFFCTECGEYHDEFGCAWFRHHVIIDENKSETTPTYVTFVDQDNDKFCLEYDSSTFDKSIIAEMFEKLRLETIAKKQEDDRKKEYEKQLAIWRGAGPK
jgi:hypothetical protein